MDSREYFVMPLAKYARLRGVRIHFMTTMTANEFELALNGDRLEHRRVEVLRDDMDHLLVQEFMRIAREKGAREPDITDRVGTLHAGRHLLLLDEDDGRLVAHYHAHVKEEHGESVRPVSFKLPVGMVM